MYMVDQPPTDRIEFSGEGGELRINGGQGATIR